MENNIHWLRPEIDLGRNSSLAFMGRCGDRGTHRLMGRRELCEAREDGCKSLAQSKWWLV